MSPCTGDDCGGEGLNMYPSLLLDWVEQASPNGRTRALRRSLKKIEINPEEDASETLIGRKRRTKKMHVHTARRRADSSRRPQKAVAAQIGCQRAVSVHARTGHERGPYPSRAAHAFLDGATVVSAGEGAPCTPESRRCPRTCSRGTQAATPAIGARDVSREVSVAS